MPFDNAPLCGSTNRGGFVSTVDQLDRGKSELGIGYTLAASGVAVPMTGSAAEQPLALISLPGGLLGLSGFVRVTSFWSVTNSANNKALRCRLGGAAIYSQNVTATATVRMSGMAMNRGSESVQMVLSGSAAFGDGATTAAVLAGAVDTSQDQVIGLYGQLASAAETITLEAYLIEVFPSS